MITIITLVDGSWKRATSVIAASFRLLRPYVDELVPPWRALEKRMTPEPHPAVVEAARAICRALGADPDAASSSEYGAPKHWEHFWPHASMAGATFAARLRPMAEEARAAAMKTADQLQAERLKARADALHEVAAMLGARPDAGNVVEFRRK